MKAEVGRGSWERKEPRLDKGRDCVSLKQEHPPCITLRGHWDLWKGVLSPPADHHGLPHPAVPMTSLSLSCFRGNTLQTNDSTYFKSCTYDPFFNPSCPVFRIGDVVEAAGETFGDLALLVCAFPLKTWKKTANFPRVWVRKGLD